MSRKLFLLLGSVFAILSASEAGLFAQMVDPKIDNPNEPFSYFSRPADVIGVMDAQAATEVTSEGYLYTGFGELMFFAGADAIPIEQRVKTLEKGWLPVVEYLYRRDGLAYQFQMFAATLEGTPNGTLVNFVRVTVKNESGKHATAYFSTAIRYTNQSTTATGVGDNRYRRPVPLNKPGDMQQIGEVFNPNWEYGFSKDAFLRDGRVLYLFPTDPTPVLRMTPQENYNRIPDLNPRKLDVFPTTPTGVSQYRMPLGAGEQAVLTFKMPYVPMAPDSPEAAALRSASYDEYLSKTGAAWASILARGLNISVPEEKVVQTFNTSLVYDLLARDKIGDQYIQTVNKFQYHRFYLRDTADIVHMYDVTGYPEIAKQVLDFFGERQQPDGNFVSQEGQYDGWGEALLGYGQHFHITHDLAFARSVYPRIVKAIAWLEAARRDDPLHLMPATSIHDNEYVTGHITGYNFLALAGLKNAIAMAEALGETQDAERFHKDYTDYDAALRAALDRATTKTGGSLPPALDGSTDGEDWGNLLSLTPEIILDPNSPMVTATLRSAQGKYQEGIMTYGGGRWLHHYLTIKNTYTEVIREDQEQAVRELYGLLLHTSSTHAGFEYAIRPWGNRDFSLNLSPHGWFASEYRTLLRNMLVREQDDDLHLLSVISPDWVRPGKSITVKRAPTCFGPVHYALEFLSDTQATLHLDTQFTSSPKRILFHFPWFMNTSAVSADGKLLEIMNSEVELPANTREVRLTWTKRPGTAEMSYEKAVADYKAEYRSRYERMLRDGVSSPQ